MTDFRALPSTGLGIALASLLAAGCATSKASAPAPVEVPPAQCAMAPATAWIDRWFAAWELASTRILKLQAAPAPEILFFDETCVYTTSATAAADRPPVEGPRFQGARLSWRAFAHGGSIRLPDGSEMPVQLSTFTSATPGGDPFFVMAAPAFWTKSGHGEEPELTGIFLHEFTHTRQLGSLSWQLAPIDAAWPGPEELTDDAVQKRFSDDPDYVAAYTAERDQLFAAAEAAGDDSARALAAEALAGMRLRHSRWFTGESVLYADADQAFLALEGAGQWTGAAWLSHPDGGRLDRESAIRIMLGRRKWWVQDEGLALFLAIDRLLPGWPELAFAERAPGALELLDRAVNR